MLCRFPPEKIATYILYFLEFQERKEVKDDQGCLVSISPHLLTRKKKSDTEWPDVQMDELG